MSEPYSNRLNVESGDNLPRFPEFSLVDFDNLKLLEQRYPNVVHDFFVYFQREHMIGRHPHLALVGWSGTCRLPLGLSIDGKAVVRGAVHDLQDKNDFTIAHFSRIYDVPVGPDPFQLMLVYWSD